MKLIVCLDDNNGMMFNKRRQSRDRLLIENMLELCKGERLYTNEYSGKLFSENTRLYARLLHLRVIADVDVDADDITIVDETGKNDVYEKNYLNWRWNRWSCYT